MPVSLLRLRPLFVGLWLVGVLCSADVYAQNGLDYDASWYVDDAPYVKIDVVEDGVYRISGSDIADALPSGTSLSSIDPATLQLFERGQEVPIDVSATGSLTDSDAIVFVGTRNRGTDETWAYNEETAWQSSTHRSLYTDTTTYWLTWNQTDSGLRYTESDAEAVSPTTTLRDTAWAERDTRYYFGRPNENGSPLYTESEGYYWHRFSHNNTGTRTFTHTLSVDRRDEDANTPLDLRLRFDTETNSCHRVEVEARLSDGGSASFESLGTESWQGLSRRTFEADVDPDRIPNDGLDLRITSYNDGFDSGCPPPASTPNYVLLDWISADYTRTLRARSEDWQRLVLPNSGSYTLPLTDHTGTPVVYSPNTGQKATANADDEVSVNNAEAEAAYWAVGESGYKTPTQLRPHTGTDWTDPNAHAADYVLVVPPALEESGEAMAEYRSVQGGYDVAVVPLHDIFDAFDYGRPSPVALRRFAHHTRDWSTAPQFLSLWGDAQHPIYTNNIENRTPDWSIPSFGYSPSDGWFAMQQNGAGDWSEFMAVGRIPVRTNAQAELFLEKIETYETAPLDLWQQRMMLLAGGTTSSEQQSLQFYSDRWGEWATGTEDSLYVAGMDTTRYYKRVDDALDSSLQDSLATSLQRGAGWLNYFGHSAAQTWEIVTDPPEEFDNAGRLPVVVSLGCRTGSFAGGRFEVASAPSLGEQLVVGSLRDDGTPISGSENGGIAHWGTSALGNRIPSARLNDELVDRVFRDTMRVLGSAIQDAKADVADRFGSSNTYRRHLLQYSLLGDPATEIAIAGKPDFHLTSDAIRISPSSPTPDDELTVELRLRNRGIVAHDSVTVILDWTRPDGTTTTRERRVPRFAVERPESFTFDLDGASIGTNTFRASIDPEGTYDEEVEANNTATREQVVFDTNVALISPIDQHTVDTRWTGYFLVIIRKEWI
ncbi:MAG: C25 family cysteine peptidase [Longimonas sp.]|uniref:C25 family cysteine peptidase n=1 Tax=Longimonas sp. TaxID=2039626 RepID=UPI003976A74D